MLFARDVRPGHDNFAPRFNMGGEVMAVLEAEMAIEVPVEVRDGTYGDAVAAVEPGGAEFIPLSERHGVPRTLFGTWTSPNLEFATVFVGVIAVSFFGQSFWAAVLAIVIGTGLGSITHGFLSSRGPAFGVPQMVQSRISFGFIGNLLPAGLNSVTAGIGWFAVNSVSGTTSYNCSSGGCCRSLARRLCSRPW
jgi:NCS1 family nucleobase:cation symporter-1